MIGFAPGFPYLSGLDPSLALPRLATPRTRVPAGSVAIGGAQTGIYPRESPGGWRLLGRTPLRLFDPQRASPSLLAPGDRVLTTSGLHATVVATADETLDLEIASGVRTRWDRRVIREKLSDTTTPGGTGAPGVTEPRSETTPE